MAQKKLMLLGGIRYLLPVIETAHGMGLYVITCDYLPNNIAHKYSDEYVNVNIVNKEQVLHIAIEKQIDGIMSFGVDPGVVAASYVQNKMGLPSFGPFESVEILQNKDKFRTFLTENGFNAPRAKSYDNKKDALKDSATWAYPIIVKPTDSAGSKGVTCVNNLKGLPTAIDYAFEHSIKGHIIIEDFIEKKGCSSDTDSFSENGKLKFISFSAQRFDSKATNPYTPAAYSWPSTFTQEQEAYLTYEIQRLLTLLHMNTSIYNIEVRVGTNNKPYIMEVTPRGGGNRLAEMLRYATGVDLIEACICAAVGNPIPNITQKPYQGYWAEVILHAEQNGTFKELIISEELISKVIERDLWVKPNDAVHSFEGANDAIGTLVLRFDNKIELEEAMSNQESWIRVAVE